MENAPVEFGVGQNFNGSFFISTKQNVSQVLPFLINANGIKTQPLQPFFSAYLNHFIQSMSSAENPITKIIPELVISNVGHHYDPSTGAFTAPVDGQYSFKVGARITTIPESISSVVLRLTTGNTTYDQSYVVEKSTNRVRDLSMLKLAFMKAGEVASAMISTNYPVNIVATDGFGESVYPRTYFQGKLLG